MMKKMPYHFLRNKIYKLPPAPYINFEEFGTYIKINGNIYSENAYNTYSSYEFKVNKRGGDVSKVSFSTPLNYFNINDKVEYYLNGKKRFAGYVESIDNAGLNLSIIPIWGKLLHQYIQGDLILEATKGALDIVLSLKEKIEEMNIIFDEKNITINNDKQITMSFSGKNISDILDEVEESLSDTWCWGVDFDGYFYFKEFSDIPTKKLNWHNNDFSDSEYEEDSADLVSRYIIKMKDTITDDEGNEEEVYRTLPKIVGADKLYPQIPLEKEIGIKTDIFEIEYKLENYDLAYEFAYQFLTNQTKKEIVKIKTLNSKNYDLNINECIECILKPTNNFYQIIDFNDFTETESRLNEVYSSDIIDIDSSIEYRKYPNYKQQQSVTLTDIDRYYKQICNQSYNITKIVIFFSDGIQDEEKNKNISAVFQIEDKEHFQRKYFTNGFGVFDVRGYDKRNIIITSERGNILYDKFICFFDIGSRVVDMNVRTIDYKFEKNALNIDLELAKMNINLTNYLYNQEERRKNLERILNSSGF
ncbi:hypothetical protein OFR41_08190 [Brachyspira hyodysenteriae]|uniref:hypothetical protein n=1 Tax=Brachyspira hyodysenteriae TaxID=159 RepID=UPI00063D8924|nr:hypothetical protein [Brachyspira hyodysenteriae]KLI30893.1 hypothetical protein SZ49_05350 [Brachyspira hyodysenteriae]MCZ9892294.1 hypothetical protein [Brachyspira hyodysenteriae]MCZ9989839.1 hypothetical protein [Brachyspira hyodysenteriae]MCZ9998206.1 hypothetical protein [Brachyspira hyodysenteriae]MDA0001641.1 hypothetical protein [Brachyspira hyodysenteriae]